jgi:hypothetical protein
MTILRILIRKILNRRILSSNVIDLTKAEQSWHILDFRTRPKHHGGNYVIATKLVIFVLPTLLLCGIVINTAGAQDNNTSQSSTPFAGWNTGSANAHEITVSGTIQQVVAAHPAGSPAGIHLLVESSQGAVNASVGPFLPKDVQRDLSVGQQVQVTGIIRVINGQSYLLARQLSVAGKQITLRNEHGFPFSIPSVNGSAPRQKQNASNGGVQ